MTNEACLQKVYDACTIIEKQIDQTIKLSQYVIGNTFTKYDLFLCPLLNRSIQLSQGFMVLIKQRNLTCAGSMLRLQLDNCMRLYASTIADDQNALIDCVISGKKISSLRDTNGQKMSDKFLKDGLAQYDSQFADVYDNTSGYIHYSGKSFYQSISASNGEEYDISIRISKEPSEKVNEALCECIDAFIHYTNFFMRMMEGAALSKATLEKTLDEEEKNGN